MASTKTILGFIAGASIGAIAGILLAPESGFNTRKKIMDKSGDFIDAIKDGLTGLTDKLQTDENAEINKTEPLTVHGEEKIRKVMHHAKENIS